MKMILNALTIEHFKGVKRFGIEPNGCNLSITGRNRLGKTTVYDAFLWLLFGKNSAGETKFTVKPTDEPQETENTVEARFTVDGKSLALKKVYASKYIKTTGEYKGSELEYYINGVPKKKSEYEAAIAQIIDEEQFKLLTNPKYFTEVLDWKKRREILFSLAGTKSDGELAKENSEFEEIRSELETMGSATELLKAVSAQVKKNSERINILPKLINENSAKLSEIPTGSEKELAERCENIRKGIAVNNEKIGGLKAWKPVESPEYAEAKRELSELLRNNDRHRWEQSQNAQKLRAEYDGKRQGLTAELNSLKKAKITYEQTIERLNGIRAELTEQRRNVTARKWDGDKVCPTCGQALPEEKIAAAKAEFDGNTEKALAEINEKFKAVGKNLTEAVADNNKAFQSIFEIEKALADIIPPVENGVFDLPEFEERHKFLADKLEELSLRDIENPHTAEIERLAEENASLERELAENMRTAENIRKNAELNARIGELKSEQAHLRGEQAVLQKRLDLANAFVRYKTDLVTESVNSMFSTVRFKLFEPNKTNDGLQECCEAVAFGAARYGDINTAGKILAGIDIIAALAERYGLSVPLFIDNIDGLDGESFAALTERVKGKMQLVTLRVSEDGQLRTEVF
ncbi:MAG: AAA family ATPase [Ruminococcus sp.]|nr:AAA family ATPase [Ruminococcus sp.]MCM1381375.1 AAA family ATPase [Muribaculaceae bacterium]